jgi:hypothetical protein
LSPPFLVVDSQIYAITEVFEGIYSVFTSVWECYDHILNTFCYSILKIDHLTFLEIVLMSEILPANQGINTDKMMQRISHLTTS